MFPSRPLFLCLVCIGTLLIIGQHAVYGVQDAADLTVEEISVLNVADGDLLPVVIEPVGRVSTSVDNNGSVVIDEASFTALRKDGVATIEPNSVMTYDITLSNYSHSTLSWWINEQLPPELVDVQVLPESSDLTYDSHTHTLHWNGDLAGAHLEYVAQPAAVGLPYIDLADYGVPNLCDEFGSGGCDDVNITFNLGANGYSANLYGSLLYDITVSSNGILLGTAAPGSDLHARSRLLPSYDAPDFTLAPLWLDYNFERGGRWHAAVVQGLLADHDVFYVQWHDAPHSTHPNLSTRHAVAVVLDDSGPLAGHLFYLYDNVSDPNALREVGYTIGLEDRVGGRGLTWAHAPCCGAWTSPFGEPPAAGSTLHLYPHLLSPDGDYARTFRYTARVAAEAPATIHTNLYADSTSSDPTYSRVWANHAVDVCWHAYFPQIPYHPTVRTVTGEMAP